MHTKSVRLMALVASIAFAACGDTTDLVLGELSEAESQELAGALLVATFNSTGDVPQPAAAGPQLAPFAYAAEFEGDVPCPLGGLVAVAASFEASGDTESEAGHIEYSMTQLHDGCVVASESGQQFTLNGTDEALTVHFSVDNNGQGVVEWSGSVQGTVDWVTDGRMGSCTASFEFSGRQAGEESVTGAAAGSICGHIVQQEFSIG